MLDGMVDRIPTPTNAPPGAPAIVTPGILILDVNGTVIFASEEAASLLGRPAAELSGVPAASLWINLDHHHSYNMPIIVDRRGRPLQTMFIPLSANQLYPDNPPLTLIVIQPQAEADENPPQLEQLVALGRQAARILQALDSPLHTIANACNDLLRQIADDELDDDQLLHYIGLIDQNVWRSMRLAQAARRQTTA
jgi:hypothetical protein